MSALRKAGVWLGLVEEEDERPDIPYDDEFDDADDEDFAPPARPRSLARPSQRGSDREPRVDHRDGRSEHRVRDSRDSRGSRDTGTGEYVQTRSRLAAERPDPRPEPRSERVGDRLADHRGSDRDERDFDARTPDWSGRGDDSARAETARPDSSRGVRQLTRSTPPPPPPVSSVSYPTQDNLALAPQVHLRERGVVADEKNRRYQIMTLHPTNYSEARTIGEHFRAGYPVIINLTELDQADAKRLVDFAAGLAFGLHGSMERVTNRVFLLSPPNIQVSAEDKAKIAEGGFFDHE